MKKITSLQALYKEKQNYKGSDWQYFVFTTLKGCKATLLTEAIDSGQCELVKTFCDSLTTPTISRIFDQLQLHTKDKWLIYAGHMLGGMEDEKYQSVLRGCSTDMAVTLSRKPETTLCFPWQKRIQTSPANSYAMDETRFPPSLSHTMKLSIPLDEFPEERAPRMGGRRL